MQEKLVDDNRFTMKRIGRGLLAPVLELAHIEHRQKNSESFFKSKTSINTIAKTLMAEMHRTYGTDMYQPSDRIGVGKVYGIPYVIFESAHQEKIIQLKIR